MQCLPAILTIAAGMAYKVSMPVTDVSLMPVTHAILTIAAGMAYKDPWVLPLDKKQAADDARRRFARESLSDHLALMHAYNEWLRVPGHQAKDWSVTYVSLMPVTYARLQ